MPAWPTEMVERLHALFKDDVSANDIAKLLNAEFGVRLTRNGVLGRLFRDRRTDAQIPKKQGGKVKGCGRLQRMGDPDAGKDRWRKDDERWLEALTMRRRGHKWDFVAAHLKVPIAELQTRLRAIALDDIKQGGNRKQWSYVFDHAPNNEEGDE